MDKIVKILTFLIAVSIGSSQATAKTFMLSKPIHLSSNNPAMSGVATVFVLAWDAVAVSAGYWGGGSGGGATVLIWDGLVTPPWIYGVTRGVSELKQIPLQEKVLDGIRGRGVSNVRVLKNSQTRGVGPLITGMDTDFFIFVDSETTPSSYEGIEWVEIDPVETKIRFRLIIDGERVEVKPLDLTLDDLSTRAKFEGKLRDEWVKRVDDWKRSYGRIARIKNLTLRNGQLIKDVMTFTDPPTDVPKINASSFNDAVKVESFLANGDREVPLGSFSRGAGVENLLRSDIGSRAKDLVKTGLKDCSYLFRKIERIKSRPLGE